MIRESKAETVLLDMGSLPQPLTVTSEWYSCAGLSVAQLQNNLPRL